MEDAVKLKKQLRLTRVVLFIFVTLSFLFFVYAYVKILAADKQHARATEFQIQAEEANRMAEQARDEAERQKMIAISSRAEALRALEDCQKKK